MRDRDPEFDAWVQRARDVPILDVAAMLGAILRKAGAGEMVGACPNCGGEDRFQVKGSDNVFLCRGSDGKGDGIAMAQHVRGLEFITACELILNEPPPRQDSKALTVPVDHEAARIEHERRQDTELLTTSKDLAERARKKGRSLEVFDSGKPIFATWAARYLDLRALKLLPEQAGFLRFVSDHPYYHGVDEDGRPKKIGIWPAVVALMRDSAGAGIGIHCTYLDALSPIKIDVPDPDAPPDRPKKLNPRKMYGTQGLIRLSDISPIMVIGEGIETTLSWFELHPNIECGIAAAGSLGNMSGAALGTLPHPRLRKRTIPNGIPDPEKRGMLAFIPPEVKEVILLGDRDQDGANVAAHLLTACNRLRAAGISVSVHMAPPIPAGKVKWDWNDELVARGKRAPEAA